MAETTEQRWTSVRPTQAQMPAPIGITTSARIHVARPEQRMHRRTDPAPLRRVYRFELAAGLVALLVIFLVSLKSHAAAVTVPAALQGQLVGKLAAYDRNLAARAGAAVRVLVVHQPGNAESLSVAERVTSELSALRVIAGMNREVRSIPFRGPAALAEACRAEKIAIVYLSAGLEADATAIGAALDGRDILTIGASSAHARQGAVVAFDLQEGKPRILVNLVQAKRQNVAFSADFLKLAMIVGER
jgi:hypothetical protein